MNVEVNNTSQEVLMQGLISCVEVMINRSDISETLGEWCAIIAMLLRTDELLEVLKDQKVILGEEDLRALNQHLLDLEKIRDNHETPIEEREEVLYKLLNCLRKILASSAHSRNGISGV